jgi:hypothetical protein
MGVMCKVGVVDHPEGGEYGGCRSSGVKGRGRRGVEGEERRRERKKREEKSWGRERKMGQEWAKQLIFGQNRRGR